MRGATKGGIAACKRVKPVNDWEHAIATKGILLDETTREPIAHRTPSIERKQEHKSIPTYLGNGTIQENSASCLYIIVKTIMLDHCMLGHATFF